MQDEHIPPGRVELRRERSKRVREMYADYLEGMSLAQVGRKHGIGPERVRQLFALERLPRRRPGWKKRWVKRYREGADGSR
jgi:uncharacterized protein YjcR